MQPTTIEALNEQLSIPGHLQFTKGAGDLVTVTVNNSLCSAAITLAGGHVISYQPKGQPDLMWMSPNSAYAVGKPLRGGIPLCWPWFGPHPTDAQNLPMHGFARLLLWSVSGTRVLEDGTTQVRLAVSDTAETRAWWPYTFELELVVTCGAKLGVDLVVRNTGSQPFTYTAALHTYFLVSDVGQISVSGLEDTDYLDKLDNFVRKHQDGAVTVSAQKDRVYVDTERECVIIDPGMGRAIHNVKSGSRTTVVWNPAERAAQMADIGIGNDVHFICVETANAANDIIQVLPGDESHLAAVIWVEQAV